MHQFLKYFLVHQLPIEPKRNLAYRKIVQQVVAQL